jgi:hypothetical protein
MLLVKHTYKLPWVHDSHASAGSPTSGWIKVHTLFLALTIRGMLRPNGKSSFVSTTFSAVNGLGTGIDLVHVLGVCMVLYLE